MKATVAERGQVTIPKPLRDKLGLRPGTKLDFYEQSGKLVAVKIAEADPVGDVFGRLGRGWKTDDLIASLRGED
jgi:antitoxin PrlF